MKHGKTIVRVYAIGSTIVSLLGLLGLLGLAITFIPAGSGIVPTDIAIILIPIFIIGVLINYGLYVFNSTARTIWTIFAMFSILSNIISINTLLTVFICYLIWVDDDTSNLFIPRRKKK